VAVTTLRKASTAVVDPLSCRGAATGPPFILPAEATKASVEVDAIILTSVVARVASRVAVDPILKEAVPVAPNVPALVQDKLALAPRIWT
jgi:hypothetical protein